MSYVIKNVEIDGFQGSRRVNVALAPDVNFIIGRNGTGKTSFVRLVHACLSLDFDELVQSTFRLIVVRFHDTETNKTPVLKIERDQGNRNYFQISFRSSGKARFVRYVIDEPDPATGARARTILSELLQSRQSAAAEGYRPIGDLRRQLKRQLQFSWLPLLRSRTSTRRNEYVTHDMLEEPINRKIRELVSQITSYLAVLDSRVSLSNKRFQRDVFIAYVAKGLFDIKAMLSLELDQEQSHLLQMLQEMEFPLDDLVEELNRFTSEAKHTQSNIDASAPSLSVLEVVNVVTANALHRIVRSFQKYTKEKENILFPQTQFLALLNELLYRKEAFFDEGNVLNVRGGYEEIDEDIGPAPKMSIYTLSSGEKQLLVILSETLLQQNREYVFIADEPELSLHVEWQERLVRTIREMNGNAQIIFATHSPDIVSVYQDRVIDFENV